MSIGDNESAWRLKHEGIRAGEIVAYRAWRVLINPGGWFRRSSDDRLHSVYMDPWFIIGLLDGATARIELPRSILGPRPALELSAELVVMPRM
jgi:hypothetical protein